MQLDDGTTVNLFTSVRDQAFDVQRAIMQCAMDSRRSSTASQGSTERPPLKECIAVLLHRGTHVRLTWRPCVSSPLHDDLVCFEGTEDGLTDLLCVAHSATRRPPPEVLPPSRAVVGGFLLETTPPLHLPSLLPGGVPWATIADSERVTVRVSFVSARGVRLFVNGIAEAEEPNDHVGLLVSVERSGPFLTLPTRPHDARAFVDHLLTPRAMQALAGSAIARGLMEKARGWRAALCDVAPLNEEDYMRMLRTLPDAYVLMLDPRPLPHVMLVDERVKHLAMIVSRRLLPPMRELSGNLYNDMVEAFAVDAVAAMSVGRDRLLHLHHIGFFDDAPYRACGCGVLLTATTGERILLFAHDATETDMTLGMSQLLECDTSERAVEGWVVVPGKINIHRFRECGPSDAMDAFRLHMGGAGHGLRLARDPDLPTRCANECMCIDDLAVEDIPYDALDRRDHQALTTAFPDLARRLASGRYEDFLTEVKGRKTCYEWSYEDLDSGGDLSCLGMSILLCLVLELWHGARARVYVSAHRTAMVAVFMDDDVVLVDPCSSKCNAVTLCFEDVRACPVKVRKGTVVEVKVTNQWLVGVVEKVIRPHSHHTSLSASATVQLMGSGRHRAVALSTKTWRPLARSPDSDVEKVIRRLWSRPPAPPSAPSAPSAFVVEEVEVDRHRVTPGLTGSSE